MTMSHIISQALKEGRNLLLEPEAKKLCSLYGIPVPRYAVVSTVDEAVKAAKGIGFPVVLKIVSKDIIHKSDSGCVVLNINSSEEVERAFKYVVANASKVGSNVEIKGVLIEEMLPKGLEVVVGALEDAEFGPIVMFGLGGIFIEVLRDVTFRAAPITIDEAKKMMKEVKGYKLLEGYRGQEPADTNALAKIITAVSRLIIENKEICQIDLNPVIVWRNGAKIADARILLRGGAQTRHICNDSAVSE